MAACRYRVSKLRSEIESERKRQGRLQKSVGRKIRTLEACKHSAASTSVIKVVSAPALSSSRVRVAASTGEPSPDWSTKYELDKGDWDTPVQVHVSRFQKTPVSTTSLRHLVAAKTIARWLKHSLDARRAASAPPPPTPTVLAPIRVDPAELLARIAQQINERANLQRQNRAAHVIQRFFTHLLDLRSTSSGQQHRSHRILLRQQARRRLAQEQIAMEKAVRLIQAAYRGSSARRRFTWKQSKVKGHFVHVLILEAEWTARPGTAALLKQLAAAYWTYFDQPDNVYEPAQRTLMLRMHLLCATKAATYGLNPESGDASEWWVTIGRRFLLLWERTSDEPALLQEALAAFDRALRVRPDHGVDPEVLCDIVHVQFALGLYCHVIKRCQNVAFEFWENAARKHQLWLWEGQAYFHVGDYQDAAIRFQAILNHSSPSADLMPYSDVELWLIMGRCGSLAHSPAQAQLFYDKILRHLYAHDDIVRRGLSWEDVTKDATLHLAAGAKFAVHRAFPLAIDLLRHGMGLNSAATSPDHDVLLAECERHTAHLDTRASRAVWEAQKRLPLTRLRERLGVVL